MTLFFLILFLSSLLIVSFFYLPKFGKHPSGEHLELIKKSPNFKNGSFANLNYTPALTEGASYYTVLKEFIYGNKQRVKPLKEIPAIKTNLHALDINQNLLVWFGHSSYYFQLDGKRFLVDPVLSGNASPVPGSIKAFKGANIYSADDIPEVDYLFITHDHWDHLDYKTIIKLKSKVKVIVCGLGTGSHLKHWGFKKEQIIENDWHSNINLESGFVVNTLPARHFSGRGLVRNKTLWASFLLQTPSMKIFIGGDSGYDTHFAEIGKRFGEIDLVILENGQYDKNWKYIHTHPHEFLNVAKELNAKHVFPVHSGKFALANHAWHEPLSKVYEYNKTEMLSLVTPLIGEIVNLNALQQDYKQWWLSVE